MDEKYIWIAKGFVVSSRQKMPLPEFIEKSDDILLNVISPLVKNLQQRGFLIRWYSSRSEPRKNIQYWRARCYFEVPEKNKDEVLKIIDQNADDIEIIDEFKPSRQSSNFDVLQKSSEIALEQLRKAKSIDRNSEEFLQEIDKVVENHKEIQNNEGIHWLENNLGYVTNFLGRRYCQQGILQKGW
jgi:hypothetical protein